MLVLKDKVKEIFDAPFVYETSDLRLKVDLSIGMAIYPDDAQDIEALVAKADLEMYQMKRKGKQEN